jgi:hypothetical protein
VSYAPNFSSYNTSSDYGQYPGILYVPIGAPAEEYNEPEEDEYEEE